MNVKFYNYDVHVFIVVVINSYWWLYIIIGVSKDCYLQRSIQCNLSLFCLLGIFWQLIDILSIHIQLKSHKILQTPLINFQRQNIWILFIQVVLMDFDVNVLYNLAITFCFFSFKFTHFTWEILFLKINFWTMIKTKIKRGRLLTIIPDLQRDVSIMTQEVCLSVHKNLL